MTDKKISTKIGTTRCGVLVLIPHSQNYWEIKDFMDVFDSDGLVDVLCIVEYLNAMPTVIPGLQVISGTLKFLNELFAGLINDRDFKSVLEKLGLANSIMRRSVGKLLVDVEFRE